MTRPTTSAELFADAAKELVHIMMRGRQIETAKALYVRTVYLSELLNKDIIKSWHPKIFDEYLKGPIFNGRFIRQLSRQLNPFFPNI